MDIEEVYTKNYPVDNNEVEPLVLLKITLNSTGLNRTNMISLFNELDKALKSIGFEVELAEGI